MPTSSTRLLAIAAHSAPSRMGASLLPEPFASRLARREKRALGDVFGLRNFGVNLTRLPPGSISALHHRHARQDELVYVLAGTPTLVTDDGEQELAPGDCAGFAAGGPAHHLENRSSADVVVLEVGDRTAGDEVTYPHDDLALAQGPDGRWVASHKDGTPY